MVDLDGAIKLAISALSVNDSKEALKILKPFEKSLKTDNSENVQLFQVYADAYLENGQLDQAYPLLVKACELDPKGEITGSEKFFTLGQIVGSTDGIKILMQGIENLTGSSGELLKQEQIDKVVGGILAMIEIWLTDLCMEPDAESQCEELISKAIKISDAKSPETWSMLGSIRISQQRFEEAVEAFEKSWEFFRLKKENLERDMRCEVDNANPRSYAEYIELIQPFLALSKMCIEMGLYNTSLQILGAVKEIDEDNMEGYYLEGFTNYLIAKTSFFELQNPGVTINPNNIYELNQHIQGLPLDFSSEIIQEPIQEARVALSFALRLGENSDPDDEIAQELVIGTQSILQELGGPIDTAELIKLKRGEEVSAQDDVELDALSD
ncbi:Acl4p Ecym_4229 [Eremothecium cymbalariae DBVPG|uniref:Assembly chaperone of RPL4 n=1 Tax=Eremothecium cymbalariae (strain CBS 270.75 / DBVPG 7215 / KCTC 17166 / NRRL Y-17582) TaxID=931890 RepID=G8JTE3_ERECY|nr:hypothetical protein Ecym_4229 [Eremothecium cymbalariae DBVPG\